MNDPNRFSLSCPQGEFKEDVLSWLGSIADYLKDTKTKCLDLTDTPLVDSLKSVGMDIQSFLDYLVGSEITEIYLRDVDLNNKIGYVCKALSKTKIKKLNLSFCNLYDDDLLTLIAALRNTRVTELCIIENPSFLNNEQVDKFCTYLAASHLRSLKLHLIIFPFEKLSALSQALPGIQITRLSFYKLIGFVQPSRTEAHFLNNFISELPYSTLTELHLNDCHLADDSMRALVGCLEDSKLEVLDLCGNGVTDSGVDSLVPGLIRSKIICLKLELNSIKGDNSLGDSLKHTTIRELDLSQNPIINERMFSGPNFLQGSTVAKLNLRAPISPCERVSLSIRDLGLSNLACLDISHNKLGLEHIAALSDVLSNSKITHLSLGSITLSEYCYNVLGDCLKRSVLKYICLRNTASSHESIYGIASFIDKTKGSALISVNLERNNIRSNIDIIAPTLANTTLLELDFYDDGFGNDVACITEQLKFTAITFLDLGGNDIGDAGVAELAKCLDETRVVKLHLMRNSITSRGAKALALVLRKTKLREVGLYDNQIEDDGLESLAKNAENSCITNINVGSNPGKRKLLIDRVLWENRRKIEQFADLLKRTPFFTGESNFFEFDRDFSSLDIEDYIEEHLEFYKTVSEEPFVLSAIEQDKYILDLKKLNHGKLISVCKDRHFNVCIEDCELIYNKIVEHPSPFQDTRKENHGASYFQKQIMWLISEYFPTKLVSFLGGKVEADVEQHVNLLKRIEEAGFSSVVEILLLNRPVYMIDEKEKILHPHVYKLLSKYKITVCNTDIEPKGVKNIIKYFEEHSDVDGASEIISLLNDIKGQVYDT